MKDQIDRPADTDRGAVWEAPGPGSWAFDRSHQTAPFPRFMDPFLDAYTEGFGQGMRLVGAPLETIEARTVNG